MKLILDEEAKQFIMGLLDLALKTGGMKNKPLVDKVLANVQDYKEKETTEGTNKLPGDN